MTRSHEGWDSVVDYKRLSTCTWKTHERCSTSIPILFTIGQLNQLNLMDELRSLPSCE